ncbi:MAG: zeta toxin family protein [Armatimonadota bacterium]
MDYAIQPENGRYVVRVESPKTRRAYQIRFARQPTAQDIQDALNRLDTLPLQQALAFRIPDRPGAKPKPTAMRSAPPLPVLDMEDVTIPGALAQGQMPLDQALRENARIVEQAKRIIEEDQNPASLVRGLYGILNIPLRVASAAVGATVTRGGEVYGREAGKPVKIPEGDWQRRFWALASDPEMEYGAVLEASAPNVPRPIRQVGAILGDLLLDPLAYITPAKIGQAAKIGRPSEALARALGINAAEAATSNSPARVLGLGLHLLLDPSATRAAIREGLSAQPGERLSTMFASLAQAQQLRKTAAHEIAPQLSRIPEYIRHSDRAVPDEVIQAAEKAAAALGEDHPEVQALRRVQQSMARSSTGHAYTKGEDVEAVYRLAERGGLHIPETKSATFSQIRRDFAKQIERERIADLTPEQRRVEQTLAEDLSRNAELRYRQYLKQFGAVIDADNVRSFSPAYTQNPLNHTVSTHAPSSAFAEWMVYRRLAETPEPGKNTVVLLAGGGGAGKTTALGLPEIQPALRNAHLVYDTTLSNYDTAKNIIDTARRRGFNVQVIYVYREPSEAAKAVVHRAAQTGRIVPPDALANAHYGANETIRRLMRQYKRDAGVSIQFVDNTGAAPVVTQSGRVPILKHDSVLQQIREGMNEALQEASDEVRKPFERYLRPRPEQHRISAGVEPRKTAQRTADMPTMRSDAVEPGTGETAEPYRFGGLSQAAQAEAQRLSRQTRTEPGVYDKTLSAWKTTKTVLNPPSWVRNFFQNFILQYLAGEPMQPWDVARGLRQFLFNPSLRKQAWQATETTAGRTAEVGQTGLAGLAGKMLDKAAEGYEAMDRAAAAIMSLITGKHPQSYLFNYGEVPETIDFLRKTGIAPFISWQYFALPAVVRGMVNEPHRLRRVLQAVLTLQPDRQKQGEWIHLPAVREIRVGSILPLNPADFGPESDLTDPLRFWLLQPLTQLGKIREGEGYRPLGASSTQYGLPAVLSWARDTALPPAFGYYLPGIISPPEPREGQRIPRTRTDYLLGMLGFPVRPVDREADERARIKEKQYKLNQLKKRLKEETK